MEINKGKNGWRVSGLSDEQKEALKRDLMVQVNMASFDNDNYGLGDEVETRIETSILNNGDFAIKYPEAAVSNQELRDGINGWIDGTFRKILTEVKDGSKNVDSGMSKEQQKDFIMSELINNETSTPEELVANFKEQGVNAYDVDTIVKDWFDGGKREEHMNMQYGVTNKTPDDFVEQLGKSNDFLDSFIDSNETGMKPQPDVSGKKEEQGLEPDEPKSFFIGGDEASGFTKDNPKTPGYKIPSMENKDWWNRMSQEQKARYRQTHKRTKKQGMHTVESLFEKEAGTEMWATPLAKWWLLNTVTMEPKSPMFNSKSELLDYALKNHIWSAEVIGRLSEQKNPDGVGTPGKLEESSDVRSFSMEDMKAAAEKDNINVKDVVVGAEFKLNTGNVFVVDSIEKQGDVDVVNTHLKDDPKRNYRTEMNDAVKFLNEEGATKEQITPENVNVPEAHPVVSVFGDNYEVEVMDSTHIRARKVGTEKWMQPSNIGQISGGKNSGMSPEYFDALKAKGIISEEGNFFVTKEKPSKGETNEMTPTYSHVAELFDNTVNIAGKEGVDELRDNIAKWLDTGEGEENINEYVDKLEKLKEPIEQGSDIGFNKDAPVGTRFGGGEKSEPTYQQGRKYKGQQAEYYMDEKGKRRYKKHSALTDEIRKLALDNLAIDGMDLGELVERIKEQLLNSGIEHHTINEYRDQIEEISREVSGDMPTELFSAELVLPTYSQPLEQEDTGRRQLLVNTAKLEDRLVEAYTGLRKDIFKAAMIDENCIVRQSFTEIDDNGNPVTGEVDWKASLVSPMRNRKLSITFKTAIKDRKVVLPAYFETSQGKRYPFTVEAIQKAVGVGPVETKGAPGAHLAFDRSDAVLPSGTYRKSGN